MIIRVIQPAEGQVTVARFSVRRGELAFIDARQAERPEGRELAEVLQELPVPPAADERVVLAVPPRQVAVRQVSLPLTERRKVRDILPLELKGELAQDTSELVFDALPAGKGSWTACWLPVAVMSPLLAAARGAGCDAEIATYAPACWGGLIPTADRQLTVALSDGSGCALFVAGVLVYLRTFPGPAAVELRRTLAVLDVGSRFAVDRLYLFGGAAVDFRARESDFPPHSALLPTDGFLATTFAADANLARALASPAAIAQSVVSGSPVDFRQGGLAYTAGRERLRSSLKLPAILAVCLVFALFAELGVRWQLLRRDMASLDTSIATIYRQVFPTRKPVDEAAEIRAEIRRLSGTSGSSSALATLKLLADGLGEGVNGFSEVELDSNTVRLRGEARSLQAVNDLKGRLSVHFNGLELVESRSKGAAGDVTFVLRASGVTGGAE